ncbi:DNA gyrase inhibitor YacG [Sphingomonas yunnanensis]|uniref:DNA gyrase inhibitor YacG n=1 Tax=Sphingomonas yunnanensis TaxID=310400 RepID=UPI001CA6F3F0|nr:DNA gyrase inhibitor YacG [Sphingomonas yunnanensis]MBY9064202.1 DNA gyrase inhibitor YacG [Sphingomonas yunnanensis]
MTQRCPICAAPAHRDYAPFCGRGCKDRDLLRWLGDGYRLPGQPIDDEIQGGLDKSRDTA